MRVITLDRALGRMRGWLNDESKACSDAGGWWDEDAERCVMPGSGGGGGSTPDWSQGGGGSNQGGGGGGPPGPEVTPITDQPSCHAAGGVWTFDGRCVPKSKCPGMEVSEWTGECIPIGGGGGKSTGKNLTLEDKKSACMAQGLAWNDDGSCMECPPGWTINQFEGGCDGPDDSDDDDDKKKAPSGGGGGSRSGSGGGGVSGGGARMTDDDKFKWTMIVGPGIAGGLIGAGVGVLAPGAITGSRVASRTAIGAGVGAVIGFGLLLADRYVR